LPIVELRIESYCLEYLHAAIDSAKSINLFI